MKKPSHSSSGYSHMKKRQKKMLNEPIKKNLPNFCLSFSLELFKRHWNGRSSDENNWNCTFFGKIASGCRKQVFFYFQDPADLTFDSHFFLFGVFFSHHLVIRIEIKRHYGPKFVNERNNFLCFLPTWFVHNAHVLFLDITLVRWLCVCVCFQLSNK